MTSYSPIRHLAHALFLNHDPKQVLMAMLTAYFDASESQQGTKVMTMAGFVSTVTKWGKFETEWNKVLKDYGVPYLHMKEFTGSTGAYKSWKGQDDKRRSFLIDLLRITKKRVHKGFAASVRLADFATVNRDFKLKEQWGCEYSLVGMRVVTAAINWRNKRFPGSQLKFIFEDGDVGQHHLRKCLEAERLPYAFIPSKELQNGEEKYIVPFQMADFAAWEFRAAYARMHDGHYNHADPDDPLRVLRHSFQALYTQIPSDIGNIITEEGLRGLCASKNLSR